MVEINESYSIIKGSDNPLSCDVAIIKGKNHNYIFEVGSLDSIAEELNSIDNKIIIISHFHNDHIANLNKLKYDELYIGDNTYKYTKTGNIVTSDIILEDNIRLFKINCCHALGSIGMIVSDYCFVGDSLAPAYKNNNYVYNVQLLKQEIELFESLDVRYFVDSHNMDKYYEKGEVINKLKQIYNRRQKSNPYIVCEN